LEQPGTQDFGHITVPLWLTFFFGTARNRIIFAVLQLVMMQPIWLTLFWEQPGTQDFGHITNNQTRGRSGKRSNMDSIVSYRIVSMDRILIVSCPNIVDKVSTYLYFDSSSREELVLNRIELIRVVNSIRRVID
jgi:hypothetical protein